MPPVAAAAGGVTVVVGAVISDLFSLVELMNPVGPSMPLLSSPTPRRILRQPSIGLGTDLPCDAKKTMASSVQPETAVDHEEIATIGEQTLI